MLVVASASLAAAVMPTAVPLAAFSLTALAVALVSADRADVEFIDVVDGDREDLVGVRAVGRSGADRDVAAGAVRFAVDRLPATVTTPVLASMANAPAVVVLQAVGDRVGGGIGVAGRGGDADRGAVGRVLVDGVGRGVGVGDRARRRTHPRR